LTDVTLIGVQKGALWRDGSWPEAA
jgi:hypothetical protein